MGKSSLFTSGRHVHLARRAFYSIGEFVEFYSKIKKPVNQILSWFTGFSRVVSASDRNRTYASGSGGRRSIH